MTFANWTALFFACVTAMLLVIAWSLNGKDEARMRLAFTALALLSTVAAVGAFAGGQWHP